MDMIRRVGGLGLGMEIRDWELGLGVGRGRGRVRDVGLGFCFRLSSPQPCLHTWMHGMKRLDKCMIHT
jgi:hypothetical protein